ncbi:hypothetical protein TYRP_017071 [Tyrophagus putrescentiae]|nr:hypothetical protein TYRP_017071 [Tyrophagus putrescentiae]
MVRPLFQVRSQYSVTLPAFTKTVSGSLRRYRARGQRSLENLSMASAADRLPEVDIFRRRVDHHQQIGSKAGVVAGFADAIKSGQKGLTSAITAAAVARTAPAAAAASVAAHVPAATSIGTLISVIVVIGLRTVVAAFHTWSSEDDDGAAEQGDQKEDGQMELHLQMSLY